MPPAAILGSAHTTGHICADVSIIGTPVGNKTVTAGGILMARQMDPTVPHPFPPMPPCAPHIGVILGGLKTVLVVGMPQAHIGTTVDTLPKGKITKGFPTVIIGGTGGVVAGNAGGASLDDVGAGSKYA